MANGIYIGMTGASARESQLDSIADNLANAQTPGFKAGRPAFEAFLPGQDPAGPASAALVGAGLDMRTGPSITTGNPLDVSPQDNQFLSVQLGSQVAYTRNGRLSLTAEGGLQAAGYPLLNTSGQPIMVPLNTHVQVTEQGLVQANGQNVDEIGLFRFSSMPTRLAPSLLGGPAEPVDGQLKIGQIEGGNVSPIESVVQLVNAQRSFDASMRVIETYTQMAQQSNQIGRVD